MEKPYYILVAAVTIDGKIARHAHHFTDWTSTEDKEQFQDLMASSDVIIAGRNTYETAIEPMSKRNCIIFTRSVEKTRKERENLLWVNPENINLEKLLIDHNYKRICILGGTPSFDFFMTRGMVDEIHLTIEPLVFGAGLPLLSAEVPDTRFALDKVQQLNDKGSLLLIYKKL